MSDLKESYFSNDLEQFKKDFYACIEIKDKENLKKEIFSVFRAQYYKWSNDKDIEEEDIIFNEKLDYIQYDAQKLQGECKKAWIKDLEENAHEIYDSLYVEDDDRDYDSCELIEFYGEDYEEDEEEMSYEEYESWRENQTWLEYSIIDKLERYKNE